MSNVQLLTKEGDFKCKVSSTLQPAAQYSSKVIIVSYSIKFTPQKISIYLFILVYV